MKWELATNQQIKSIIESDGQCPVRLLSQAIEEAVIRDIYHNYVGQIAINMYGSLSKMEQATKSLFDEIKNRCYEKAFDALRFYKPGKSSFLHFWSNFIRNVILDEARKQTVQKRSAEIVAIDDEEVHIQITADNNTERKVINQMMIAELLEQMSEKERFIVLKRYEGYTYLEIGKMFGYTKSYIRKVHTQLAERLKGA